MWLNGSGDCRVSSPRRGGARDQEWDDAWLRVTRRHCGQCRKEHGAPPGYTSAPWSNVTVRGEKNLKWYQSSEQARRGFCRACGSSLFWEPIGQDRVAITAGCLDKPTGLRTVRHIFVSEKADFDEITDGLEQLPHSMTP